MIQWVYERASSLFEHLLVATDDQRIYDAVERFGGLVHMTSPVHSSGTERCAEAALVYEQQTGLGFSHVVNIQGDEPLIQAEQLQILIDCIQIPGTGIATLIRPLEAEEELGKSQCGESGGGSVLQGALFFQGSNSICKKLRP